MADQNDFDRRQWDNAEGVSRRSHDTRVYGSDARMGPEDYAFDDEEERYDGRQGYYRSRPATRQMGGSGAQQRGHRPQMSGAERRNRPDQGTAGQGQGQRADQEWEYEGMANQQNDDWAQQVRQNWQRGPYRDYGWEGGESVLPEFRDPSVHRTREEEQEAQDWRRRQERQGGSRPDFRRAYDAQNSRGLTTGEEERNFASGPEYGRNAWNIPGPHRGRGPRNYQRSNERIREDVNERLTEHGQIDATNIDVRVENGEVWLTGNVDSRRAKRMAEDVADSVTGVKDIHNELRIQQEQQQQAE